MGGSVDCGVGGGSGVAAGAVLQIRGKKLKPTEPRWTWGLGRSGRPWPAFEKAASATPPSTSMSSPCCVSTGLRHCQLWHESYRPRWGTPTPVNRPWHSLQCLAHSCQEHGDRPRTLWRLIHAESMPKSRQDGAPVYGANQVASCGGPWSRRKRKHHLRPLNRSRTGCDCSHQDLRTGMC